MEIIETLLETAYHKMLYPTVILGAFPIVQGGKEPTCNIGDLGGTGSIPGSGRSPEGGNANPFQYSCLENSIDREPGCLQSIESQRARHDWTHDVWTIILIHFLFLETELIRKKNASLFLVAKNASKQIIISA